jgi:2,3,4,5-tetrahydropyridine-2,6-dicarboxylate N-succinyltransferase
VLSLQQSKAIFSSPVPGTSTGGCPSRPLTEIDVCTARQAGVCWSRSQLTVILPAMQELQGQIKRLYALGPEVESLPEAEQAFARFRDALTAGAIRAAEKRDGRWQTNAWVKQGILLGFRIGKLVGSGDPRILSFVDKDTYPVRHFTPADNVRVVPGGSSVRCGAYVAPSVVCMPPMYINVGAYVDEGAMVDSHALVGSCAQVGKRVHISAAAQIGGVLEPINALPVIVEDDVLIGGNCGVYEGTHVGVRVVLGAGVILTRSTSIFDIVKGEIYRADENGRLHVPDSAVVVPGSRAITKGKAAEWGLSLYTPVIVKYRDEHTDQSTELEDFLR